MDVAGTYNVTYKVTDKNGASAVKTITVVVNPKIEELNYVPTINATDKVLTVGDNFNPLDGVTAFDKEDGDIKLTKDNVIVNNVNMDVAGTYNVTYKVTDKNGASVVKTIMVTVKDKEANKPITPEKPEEKPPVEEEKPEVIPPVEDNGDNSNTGSNSNNVNKPDNENESGDESNSTTNKLPNTGTPVGTGALSVLGMLSAFVGTKLLKKKK